MIDHPPADNDQLISKISKSIFGAGYNFFGANVHFHLGSEHTIDDVRFDLEMHAVHIPHEKKG